MFGLVITGGFIAHHSIGQFYSPDHVGWTGLEALWRSDKKVWQILWYGTLSDPNDLGQLFLILIAFSFYLVGQASSILIKMALLANLGLILFATFLTNSRGTMLGVAAMVCLWSLRKYGVFKTAIVSVVAFPAFLVITSGAGKIDSNDKSANQRLDAWVQGYFMLRDNPLFGVGKSGFAENHNKTAHNSLVLIYAETGILGYFMWTFMLFACWIWVDKLSRRRFFSDASTGSTLYNKIEAERPLAAVLMYALFSLLISSFFLSRSYSFILFATVAFILAQIVRLEALTPGYKYKFKWYLFAPISVISVIVITILSFKMK
jgi:putative inorganic carbon (HCO3(-)) transporter